jgi:hypothetical protein
MPVARSSSERAAKLASGISTRPAYLSPGITPGRVRRPPTAARAYESGKALVAVGPGTGAQARTNKRRYAERTTPRESHDGMHQSRVPVRGNLTRLDDVPRHFPQLDVEMLGSSAKYVERLFRRDPLAFDENAFGLTNDLLGA